MLFNKYIICSYWNFLEWNLYKTRFAHHSGLWAVVSRAVGNLKKALIII